MEIPKEHLLQFISHSDCHSLSEEQGRMEYESVQFNQQYGKINKSKFYTVNQIEHILIKKFLRVLICSVCFDEVTQEWNT